MSDLTSREQMASGENQVETLVTLYNRTVDALAGYVTMVEKAEPSFKPIADEFRALHATQAKDIARMLENLDPSADPDGTLMGSVNMAVVSIRAMLDKVDEGVMDSIRSGEDFVLTAFEDAIAASVDPGFRSSLTQMRTSLLGLLDSTRHLGA